MNGPALSLTAAADSGAAAGPAGTASIPEPRTPAPVRPPKVVFDGFDGLRAIAAVLVVVVHTAFPAGFTTSSRLGPYTARGEIGVAVFFLISGFLLYRPFVAARFAGIRGSDAAGYLVRRFMRIVPLYWVALAVTLTVVSSKRVGVHGLAGLLQTAFFVQGYQEHWAIQGLTQAWTLDVEAAFYLAIPVYAWLLRRRDRPPAAQLRVELAALAVTFVAAKIVHYLVIPSTQTWMNGWNVWLPVWWDLFAMGMLLAVLSAWYSRQGRSPRWAELPGSGTVCWGIAAFFYWVSSRHLGLPLVPIFEATRSQDMGKHLGYGLFGFFLLLPAVFGHGDRGWVRPLLASRPLAFLGAISYGIYLWHSAVIDLVLEHSGWRLWKIPSPPFLLVVLTLTVGVSTVTHFLIERPCITLSREWARRADRWVARRFEGAARGGEGGLVSGAGGSPGEVEVIGKPVDSPTVPLASGLMSPRNMTDRDARDPSPPVRSLDPDLPGVPDGRASRAGWKQPRVEFDGLEWLGPQPAPQPGGPGAQPAERGGPERGGPERGGSASRR